MENGSTIKFNIQKILTFSIVLFPVFDNYASPIPSISIGELIVILSILVFFVHNKNTSIFIVEDYFLFFIYILLLSISSVLFNDWISLKILFHGLSGIILYGFIIIFGASYFNLEYALKLIRQVAYVASVLFLLQEINFFVFGYRISGIIPGLRLSNMVDSDEFVKSLVASDRSSSFFTEPAHFAQFLGIALIINLFDNFNNTRSSYKFACLLTSILLMTRSGSALIIVSFIWGVFVVSKINNLSFFKKIFFLFSSFSFLFLFFIVFNDYLFRMSSRVEEIGGGLEGQLSGFIRVLRGYFLYVDFNFFQKVFGIGIGNVESFVVAHPNTLYVSITNKLIGYLNGFQSILISGGIVGVFLFYKFYYFLFSYNLKIGKVLVLLLSFLGFFTSIYNNSFWALYMIFSISLHQNYIKLNNISSINSINFNR